MFSKVTRSRSQPVLLYIQYLLMLPFLTKKCTCSGKCQSILVFISKFQFLNLWAIHWDCLHPVQHIVGWTNILWIFPLTDMAVSYCRTGPPTPSLSFHTVSSCSLVHSLMSPSLCRVLPKYLDLVTCGRWEDSWHVVMALHSNTCMCCVFALYTFNLLSPNSSLHWPGSRLSGKQERAENGSLVEANFHCKGFACSCSTLHYTDYHSWCMSFTSLVYFSGTHLSLMHQ